MMELELAGQRTPIPTGEMVIGADPSCGLRLTGVAAAHAVVIGASDGSASVRRLSDNDVLLNGVKLGPEPAPILHGDRVQVGIHELLVHDPRRSGSTQFVSAADVAKMAAVAGKPAAPKPPTAATGGRMVCLTDGREYTIGSTPLVIGREAGCDIVVPNKDVSRRHAEIFVSPQGYVLVDSSTNGTFVNGERIEAQRLLARADVIKIGDHEFRFYADKAPEAAPAARAPVSQPGMPIVPAPVPEGAAERLSHTMHGMPVPTPSAPRPVIRSSGSTVPMATFLVRNGVLKGQRLTVRVPVVNIGRADYNDLVIPDDSVSGSHAKLTRREGVWILSDNGSTNGTWVDGERIQEDVALSPGTVVRFGEVSVMFEPTDDHLGTEAGSGTKVMGAVRPAPSAPFPQPVMAAPVPAAEAPAPGAGLPRPDMHEPAEGDVAVKPPAPRRPPVVMAPAEKQKLPKWLIPAALLVVLGILAAFLLLR
ncbi:MAG TPA: FHA domain-containing protein [Gemmatimonadales bacterium]|nr:FHA domain-containing protein [Gemmatimonadales bacterium]